MDDLYEQVLNIFGIDLSNSDENDNSPIPEMVDLDEALLNFGVNLSFENNSENIITTNLDDHLLKDSIDLPAENNSQINHENSISSHSIENHESIMAVFQGFKDELEEIEGNIVFMEEQLKFLADQKTTNAPVFSSKNSPEKPSSTHNLYDEKTTVAGKTVYVGNINYTVTEEELRAHFHDCGLINKVTRKCDKITGHPKRYAFIEFSNVVSMKKALAMSDSLFKGRQIKVFPKRNYKPKPIISTTDGPVASIGRFRSYPMFHGGYKYKGWCPRIEPFYPY